MFVAEPYVNDIAVEAWRISLIAIASVVLGEVSRVMWTYRATGMTRTQFARFMALQLAVVQVIITEYQKRSEHLNWHVWMNTAILLFAIYGCWGMSHAAKRDRGPRTAAGTDQDQAAH